jgi:DNA-binding GntR family transcriptional regulator
MRDARPLSARIHDWLRGAILDLALEPGAPIVETDVAARFGASRTPVREALLRLADEELVEIRPQRGTYVARLSLPRIESAMFIRQAIECAVVRRLAARRDRAEIVAALADIVRRHARALERGDLARALDADTAFHRALVDASGLPGVWEAVERARELHHRIRAIAVPELGSGRQAVAEHRRVVAALRGGTPARAEAALAAHLARNVVLAREIARRHPGYFVADPAAVAPFLP